MTYIYVNMIFFALEHLVFRLARKNCRDQRCVSAVIFSVIYTIALFVLRLSS